MENKMNIRFYNAKILKNEKGHEFEIVEATNFIVEVQLFISKTVTNT